ncbi:LysR substrate-binding domain-containing protein [Aminobacter sp. AP02]|uniref:LysR substrate-binding domain-containing protein n=1 Tax=Aminobacter sp. AP02 TaxID=2135737 RepID=UPI000D6C5C7C|nr:LysR substrate-binding domain-containing protein [Aminobacter sp. AP02]PWK68221.1 DNA-binding transcriptional LysR family regulator [Aminobacter sp. AP02]
MNSNLNRVHLNGLRAVESVARGGSLVKAAEELGVSVSAVSQQITRTERQLGRAIFRRSGSGLVLTAFGVTFTARLTAGFQEISRAVTLADEANSKMLVVSVAPAFASRFLVPRLARFNQRFPDLKLRIDASTGLVDLDHSDVDLAIRMGDGKWPGVRAELLLAQEVFPVCAPALASRLKSPCDIAQLPVIADESTMISWERWFEAAGLRPYPILPAGPAFTDPILGIDAAIAGQGVALAWQLLSADALADGRLVAPFGITVASGLGYYLVTSATERPPRKVRDFSGWLSEEIAATMARFGSA